MSGLGFKLIESIVYFMYPLFVDMYNVLIVSGGFSYGLVHY